MEVAAMRRRAWATAGVLVCACALAAVWQSPRRGTAARVELELASDQRAARLRADLTRLARDIDDADRRRRGAGGSALERTNASGRQNARARELLARHTTAGALRRLDHATSRLMEKWLGGAKPSQQQQRDELAFGKRAYTRVRERERADRRQDRRTRSSGRQGERGDDRRSAGEEREGRDSERAGEGDRERKDEGRRRQERQGQWLDKAEREEEERVKDLVTRKAQALQRLYRKEQVCRPWLPAHAWCARNANVRMPGV